jgi:hypothetical protein
LSIARWNIQTIRNREYEWFATLALDELGWEMVDVAIVFSYNRSLAIRDTDGLGDEEVRFVERDIVVSSIDGAGIEPRHELMISQKS